MQRKLDVCEREKLGRLVDLRPMRIATFEIWAEQAYEGEGERRDMSYGTAGRDTGEDSSTAC
jgi:hypothetical protein